MNTILKIGISLIIGMCISYFLTSRDEQINNDNPLEACIHQCECGKNLRGDCVEWCRGVHIYGRTPEEQNKLVEIANTREYKARQIENTRQYAVKQVQNICGQWTTQCANYVVGILKQTENLTK